MADKKILRRFFVAVIALAGIGLAGTLVPALFTVPAGIPVFGGISLGGAATLAAAIFLAEYIADQVKALR